MKKFIFGLVVGSLLSSSVMVFATQPIKLIVNGNLVESDVPPQIISGRTMIPARPLAEALGAKVEWDAENNAVVVTGGIQVNAKPIDLEPVKNEEIINQPINNDKENNGGENVMNNTIKETTFNGLNAIDVNGTIYFSAKEYSDMFYDTKTFGYDSNKNIITFNEGENTTEIPNNSENIQMYNGRTYIHTKFYQ